MKYLNKYIVIATLMSSMILISSANAADEYNVSKGTTVDGQGVAFRGNDVYAYVNGLGIIPGEAQYTHVEDNVAYYFKSKEALEKFASAPDKYIPQYGGFCAFGVALGKKLDGSPRYADIVDGKLYLFLNAAVMDMYVKDKESVLAKAKSSWPSIHHLTIAEANDI
jgi:YHS domain-containing protein